MQQVVEVIVPGPLAVRTTTAVGLFTEARSKLCTPLIAGVTTQASKIRWDAATRARAEAAVQRAIKNWREQEQRHGSGWTS